MTTDIYAVTLPKLGLTMEQGSIAKWHAEIGASIQEGDEIVDIETEKVTMAYEAPASGVLRRVLAQIGDELPVGALIGVITKSETSDADIDNFIQNFEPPNLEPANPITDT